MRLYKKAAAVLLAAAMAVSMMTACGTTGGGSGVVEGVTYTSNADLVAGVDKDSITNVTPIQMANSRYAAFIKKMNSDPKLYIKASVANVVNGELRNIGDSEVARTEKYIYSKVSYNGQTRENLAEEATNGVYEYTFVDASEGKAAVRIFEENDLTETPDVSGTYEISGGQGTISSAQVTVNGKSYYAEIIQRGDTKSIMCYEADKPVPTYDFITKPGDRCTVEVYKTICFGTDKGTIANRLSGYTVYTATFNSETKGTLKNEVTGVTYDVTFGEGEKGYTVEKNGQETHEIDWLVKELNKKN